MCADGNVSECYHRPPGSPWLYNCKGGAPTVTGPSECPGAPPATPQPPQPPKEDPPTANTCRDWEGSGPEPGLFEADVNAAIDSACKRAGVTCGLDGPKRPGTWKDFVLHVAEGLEVVGYVVTYDYLHGEAEGRASELSVKKGDRVENYQIETSDGRVRRPHGGYRSVCVPASGEGQPIQREKPAPKPVRCAPAITGFRDVTVQSRAGNRINLNTTPEHCDSTTGSTYCATEWFGRRCCPLGEGEGPGSVHEACEKELLGHVVLTPLTGAINRVDFNEAAPAMGIVFTNPGWDGGSVRICAELAPAVCVEAVVPR